MKTVPVEPPIRLQPSLEWRSPPPGRWIVVWHRQVLPRPQLDHAQPLINISFRDLDALTPDANGQHEFTRVDRPVTELGQLRLGTIVQDGTITERAELGSPVDFPVHFPDTAAPLPRIRQLNIQDVALPPWFAGVSLGGFALALPLTGGGCLWIPCMEFLTRFYGRSQEIRRVLLTYPWAWSKPRLLSEPDPAPGASSDSDVWRVRYGWQARHLVPGDAVFLAHLRHSSWTRRCVHRLYAQLEAAHPPAPSPAFEGSYLAVDPWFSGPAMLRVSGFPLPDGGFFALRLDGASDPQGPRIVRERVRRSRDQPRRADGESGDHRRSRSRPRPAALEHGEPPDRAAFHVPLPDPPFKVLGAPQAVEEVVLESPDVPGGRSLPQGEAGVVVSTAEPSGSGKDIHSAIIHAPVESTLQNLWNIVCDLRRRFPARILSVEWYHPSVGFVFSRSPRLVPLASVSSLPNGEAGDWLNVDRGPDAGGAGSRALLVVRLLVVRDDSAPRNRWTLYLVELERRLPSQRDDSPGDGHDFSGLIFELEPSDDPVGQLDAWLGKLRAGLVASRGVFGTDLREACLGRAVSYAHLLEQPGTALELAIRGALRQMGVDLPE